MLEAIAAGAPVEPGAYRIQVRGLSFPKNPSTSGRPPMVTQRWLQSIAAVDEIGKANMVQARAERKKVLLAIQAGAPVEPGKFKVRVKTRWRRRKIA